MEIKEVFEPIVSFVKNFQKKEKDISKQAAKDRLKLVLMQDRASVSPDFFEMMKKEIIDVIKKYIEIDEDSLEVQLTRGYEAGLEGPALYANIPIKNIKPIASNGEEGELTESDIKEITENIIDSANRMSDGVSYVKAEIDSVIDDEIEDEPHENAAKEVEEKSIEEKQEEDIVEEKNIEAKNDEDKPESADIIAENVAKEMKKSAAKAAAAKVATAKRTVKKANTAKKVTKKDN